MSEQFDVLVIGGGSGLTATYFAEADGKTVALVEPGPLGGTCVNRGCIPTKTLIESAELARSIRDGARLGVHVPDKAVEVDVPAIFQRMREMREANVGHTDGWIEDSEQITLFRQRARFVGEKTVALEDGTELTAETIFICTGARPLVPPVDGLDEVSFETNETILNEMEDAPDHLAILGGGYIGLEFANFFSAVGTEVTIIEAKECLLREDADVRSAVTKGVGTYTTLHNGSRAERVRQEGDEVVLEVAKEGQAPFEVRADALLVATGRRPNTEELDLETTGVEVDEGGFIQADEHFRTSHPGIFAYGDVIGRGMFKHTSSFEGEAAWNNSQGASETVDYDKNPHAVFTHPQVGSVGLTEEEASKRGLDARAHKAGYEQTAKGEIVDAGEEAFAKVVVENGTDRILGFHVVGPQAADLVHEVVVAMNCGDGTLENVTGAIHVHPTLSELVHTVLNAA